MIARTGLTVDAHIGRTVDNLCQFRELAPEVPWIPVLQGYRMAEYEACARRYEGAGIDLEAEPRVGVGTLCRRQHTREGTSIVRRLASYGFRLHGFGFKVAGIAAAAAYLASADSMAWSYAARRRPPLLGCRHAHCNNCFRYACRWYQHVTDQFVIPRQQELFA
jgi:hypothetical protein